MATYISLVQFTDKGIQAAKDTGIEDAHLVILTQCPIHLLDAYPLRLRNVRQRVTGSGYAG